MSSLLVELEMLEGYFSVLFGMRASPEALWHVTGKSWFQVHLHVYIMCEN